MDKTSCEKLGYEVGDVFVTKTGNTAYGYAKGVKYKMIQDDGSTAPYFGAYDVFIPLEDVEKVVTSVTSTEQSYTEDEIREALKYATLGEVFAESLSVVFMNKLKQNKLEQSEGYKEYIRLKEKLGL